MIDKEEISKMLQKLGWSEKEAKVYLVTLELHEALPGAIARKAGVKRSTAYLILGDLENKGLTSHVKRGRNLFYQATKPNLFLEKTAEELKEQQSSLDELSKTLSEILSLYQTQTATPQMSVFRGKEGLIQIMEDTLTTKTELLCWANPTLVFSVLEDYYPAYIKKKVERKIWLRGIFCYDKIGVRFKHKAKAELREIYMVPKEKFPFENEINIYDDKVAIISHSDLVGIIIQNKHIANTQRHIFNLAFEYAKTLEKLVLTKEDDSYIKSRTNDDLSKKIRELQKLSKKISQNA